MDARLETSWACPVDQVRHGGAQGEWLDGEAGEVSGFRMGSRLPAPRFPALAELGWKD